MENKYQQSMAPAQSVAVLTGDLMQSTQAEPLATDQAMERLQEAANQVADWVGADTRFTRFRGDGWQIVLTRQPELALRAAVYVFAALKAQKGGLLTRVAVGIGAADFLGQDDLSDARGAAFVQSGRTLDEMKTSALRIAFPAMRPVHHGFVELVEPLLWRWTPEQAEGVSLSLHPNTRSQKEIARHLNISEQAVSLRLRGAHDYALRQALKYWENDLMLAEFAP